MTRFDLYDHLHVMSFNSVELDALYRGDIPPFGLI